MGAPQSWLPAERWIAVMLVALLVLLATIFQSSLAPGLRADGESGIVAPAGTVVEELERVRAVPASSPATAPAATTPAAE